MIFYRELRSKVLKEALLLFLLLFLAPFLKGQGTKNNIPLGKFLPNGTKNVPNKKRDYAKRCFKMLLR